MRETFGLVRARRAARRRGSASRPWVASCSSSRGKCFTTGHPARSVGHRGKVLKLGSRIAGDLQRNHHVLRYLKVIGTHSPATEPDVALGLGLSLISVSCHMQVDKMAAPFE